MPLRKARKTPTKIAFFPFFSLLDNFASLFLNVVRCSLIWKEDHLLIGHSDLNIDVRHFSCQERKTLYCVYPSSCWFGKCCPSLTFSFFFFLCLCFSKRNFLVFKCFCWSIHQSFCKNTKCLQTSETRFMHTWCVHFLPFLLYFNIFLVSFMTSSFCCNNKRILFLNKRTESHAEWFLTLVSLTVHSLDTSIVLIDSIASPTETAIMTFKIPNLCGDTVLFRALITASLFSWKLVQCNRFNMETGIDQELVS